MTPAWPASIRACTSASRRFAKPASPTWTGGRSSWSRMPSSSANAASSLHTRSDMNHARWLAVLLSLLSVSAGAATRIDLNRDWDFRTERGLAAGTPELATWPKAVPAGTSRVTVPHTWNREGADYDYLGTGWYFRRFDLPKLPADAIAQLH